MTANPENSRNNSADAAHSRLMHANEVLVGVGGRASDPATATAIYRELADKGFGAAAERLAVLAAVGVGRPANWQESLVWLSRAAELGHAGSQMQILVLAGREPSESGRNGWKSALGEIDLRVLLKAPALRQARTRPAIAMVDGLATGPMCRWLIARGMPRIEPALVGDYNTGKWVRDPIRTGLAAGFGVATTDVVMVLTQKRLELASGLMVGQQEAPYVLSYEPGQEYKAHFDFLLPNDPAFAHVIETMGQRVATCLTWLNEDYEGGETAFPKIDWKHRGKVGDAMLFLNVDTGTRKPDPMTLHAGLPVTRGRKWLLSQWVRDRALPIV